MSWRVWTVFVAFNMACIFFFRWLADELGASLWESRAIGMCAGVLYALVTLPLIRRATSSKGGTDD